VQAPPPAQTSSPALAPTPPAARSGPKEPIEKPHLAAAQQKQSSKAAAHEAAETEQKPAPPPAPAANCILGANPDRYVALAEQARGRGDYANAIRIFREVLDCDPGNAAAREGLDKAQRGAQSH
ncbi:MAG TPA: hypothetical protein VHD85_15870, partial [Terracidiphilus sp.]|nr:hypothetical protein [Terracidiphilus sp.]